MAFSYDTERREFVRIRVDIPVRYKFLSRTVDVPKEEIFEGTTRDISGSGLLLVGRIHKLEWIPMLLLEKIVIGVNIMLPSSAAPVKALTRTGWIEAIKEGDDRCAMGLKFKEITRESQDDILKYVIKSQLR